MSRNLLSWLSVEKMAIKKSLLGEQGITIKIALPKGSVPVSLALVLPRSGSKDASQPRLRSAPNSKNILAEIKIQDKAILYLWGIVVLL